jgi:hypothetical protein
VKGMKVAVDTASKQIDDYLEGLKEDSVMLTYPSPLRWVTQRRLKEICQEAKVVFDVDAYFRKTSESKEGFTTNVTLLGVDQNSIESVKGKIGDLSAPVGLEVKIPLKMTENLKAKAFEIAKDHNVGIDYGSNAVTVLLYRLMTWK